MLFKNPFLQSEDPMEIEKLELAIRQIEKEKLRLEKQLADRNLNQKVRLLIFCAFCFSHVDVFIISYPFCKKVISGLPEPRNR